jgi:hypothetical protein
MLTLMPGCALLGITKVAGQLAIDEAKKMHNKNENGEGDNESWFKKCFPCFH